MGIQWSANETLRNDRSRIYWWQQGKALSLESERIRIEWWTWSTVINRQGKNKALQRCKKSFQIAQALEKYNKTILCVYGFEKSVLHASWAKRPDWR